MKNEYLNILKLNKPLKIHCSFWCCRKKKKKQTTEKEKHLIHAGTHTMMFILYKLSLTIR